MPLTAAVSVRSIPACAGEPFGCSDAISAATVYPRVCGGTTAITAQGVMAAGLSPRVRGNLQQTRSARKPPGSIPACAGEPRFASTGPKPRTVYPRVCGGTVRPRPSPVKDAGLSPRVRGNLSVRREKERPCGSIPACAGGTFMPLVFWIPVKGLSPRVRGNLLDYGRLRLGLGSIPACAGEPRALIRSREVEKVYPRVCGGTPPRAFIAPPARGLSPRVRGNRFAA